MRALRAVVVTVTGISLVAGCERGREVGVADTIPAETTTTSDAEVGVLAPSPAASAPSPTSATTPIAPSTTAATSTTASTTVRTVTTVMGPVATTATTAVATPVATPVTRWVAIGDSLTYGVGTTDPASESWPALIAAASPSTVLSNLAIGGATSATALASQEPIAEGLHSNVATVWLGSNDLFRDVPVAEVTANLTTIIRRLQAGGARVVVGTLPPWQDAPYFDGVADAVMVAKVAAYDAGIIAAATLTGAQVVDLANVLLGAGHVIGDGLHPTAAGYASIAATWSAAVHLS